VRYVEAEDGSLIALERIATIWLREDPPAGMNDAATSWDLLALLDTPHAPIWKLATGNRDRVENLRRRIAAELPGPVWRVGAPTPARPGPFDQEDPLA
jgi:hypothetical protein